MRRAERARGPSAQLEQGVAQRALRRSMLPFVAFAAACYLAAPYLGLTARDVDPRIAEVWPPGGVGFVLLTTVWLMGTPRRRRRRWPSCWSPS